MYEKFTDRARKVMKLASDEAQRFNHEYIGTEHILLALVKEGAGVAANVLKNLDLDPRKIRLEIEKIVMPGPEMVDMGKLPETPRAKKVLEYAIEEARNLNHTYVGTEHLLLGLVREREGVAAQVLINLGLTLDTIRKEVMELLGCSDWAKSTPHTSTSPLQSRIGHRAKRMGEYDLCLPLQRSDGSVIGSEQVAEIKARLRARFGGVISLLQSVAGTMRFGEASLSGEVVVLRVFARYSGETREFLGQFKEELKSSLRQEVVILARQLRVL